MTNLRSDALITRRIVCAFIDFLNSVEPAPGVDDEGLEVAKDCLSEFFQLNQLSRSDQPEPNLLINLYTSLRQTQNESQPENNSDSPTVSAVNSVNTDHGTDLKFKDDVGTAEASEIGVSRDELFGQFFAALEKIHYFRTQGGDDEHVLLERVTGLFHDAINEIESSGCKTCDQRSLAEALKTLGNKAMQSNAYADAIERYTCAIALCENNAVYYCNRAAAYTQTGKYDEAVRDSLKAIDIDPTYSKAYSRLGFAYYSQGNYSDAITKGFKKALELDPDNSAVKENLKAAEQKLREQRRNQGFRNHLTRGSRGQAGQPPPFASVSFDGGSVPPNLASMFMNIPSQNSNGVPPPRGGPTTAFNMGIDPTNIASMFPNLTPNSHPQPNSQTNSQAGQPPPFASVSFDGGSVPPNLASMFMNMPSSQNSNGVPPPQGGPTTAFNMGIDPTNIASMFTNLIPNSHPQPNSQTNSQAGQPPPFASVSFEAGSVPPNLASMFMNTPSENSNGMPPPQGGPTTAFNMGIDPTNIASMFTNLTPNAHQQPNSQTNSSAEQNHGTETNPPPFPSMPFDPTSIPANLADMFVNSQGQPRGDSDANRPEMPEGSASGNFSFNLGGDQGRNININLGGNQNPEELMGSLRAMMGMFSRGESQGDQPGTGDGRPTSN